MILLFLFLSLSFYLPLIFSLILSLIFLLDFEGVKEIFFCWKNLMILNTNGMGKKKQNTQKIIH